MISARDAEWQARVDAFLEDNNRSEEQVKKQFANAVSFKARAEKAEAQVEKLDAEVRRRARGGGEVKNGHEIDCRCKCKECEARTQETYRLSLTCINCGWEGTALISKGDKFS